MDPNRATSGDRGMAVAQRLLYERLAKKLGKSVAEIEAMGADGTADVGLEAIPPPPH